MSITESRPELDTLSILHISTFDNRGGSAKSAYKIHRGLKLLGVESRMLVGQKTTTDPDVDTIAKGGWKAADRIIGRGLDRLDLQYVLYPSSFRLPYHPWFQKANIIQLYNTHSGYFSHSVLPKIAAQKKIVWRLSDMWPFTGHCAFSGDCGKWMTGCHSCPDLGAYPSIRRDTASVLWKWKRSLYSRMDMHVVAPSRWIQGLAEQSPLLGRFRMSYMPNGLDTGVFRPLPKSACRSILGIGEEKHVALFLSHSLEQPKKGGPFFREAMDILWEGGKRDLLAMAVGENAHAWEGKLKCPLWKRDYIGDDELLALLYNAADVFVHCALRENFPNTIMEAMACGLPIVAFDSGGVRELVDPGTTGCLVMSRDTKALAAAIASLFASVEDRDRLGKNGRETILAAHSLEKQASSFRDLYRSLLGMA